MMISNTSIVVTFVYTQLLVESLLANLFRTGLFTMNVAEDPQTRAHTHTKKNTDSWMILLQLELLGSHSV